MDLTPRAPVAMTVRLTATLLSAVSLAACAADPSSIPHSEILAQLLTDDPAVTRIKSGPDSVSAFESIQDADITPDGSHVVVVDRTSPYVYVLDRGGRGRAVFLDASARTIESVAPYAVAVRDGQVLVMDGGFRLYDLDGQSIAEVPRPGILPFDATVGCTDDWIIYGYGGKGGLPGRDEEWLQRIRFDTSGVMERQRIYADSAPPGRLGFGRPYSLARGNTDYAVLHEYGRPPAILRFSCGRYTPRAAGENAALAIESQLREDSVRTLTIAGDATPVGMAFVPDGLLASSLRQRTTEQDSTVVDTQFHLVTADSVYEVAVEGSYRLRGARFGQELLLVTDQPSPQVLLVPESALLNAIRSGRGRSR